MLAIFFNLSLILVFLISANPSFSEPYKPNHPSEVLEVIPEAFRAEEGKTFESLREQIRKNPKDIKSSSKFVQLCIEHGRKLSDPRFFGYAEAEVNRVLKENPEQFQFILFRAIIRQRNHDFVGSQNDLKQVASVMPNNAQVWLTLASVQVVIGSFTEARNSCVKLISLTTPLISTSCLALVGSLSGNADKSYSSLETLFQNVESSQATDNSELLWSLSILSEIAERIGRIEDAEKWYKKALSFDADDIFSLAAYADFLLYQKRASEVLELLKARQSVDALLLRLAIAEKQTNNINFKHDKDLLQLRIENEISRGDVTHLREVAMFLLEVEGKSKQAHEYAIRNWQNQKESIDALLLARTAQENHDIATLNLLTDWQKNNSYQDIRLERLLKEPLK